MKTITKTVPKNELPLTALQAKRVAILKDAIQQTKLHAYQPKSDSGYVVSDRLDEELCNLYYNNKSQKTQLKPLLPKLINSEKPCEICIKGGLFISAIRKFNHFTVEEAYDIGLDSPASDKIRKLFGKANADLMERYFETGFGVEQFGESAINYSPWRKLNDTERFITICKNAIKNKGIFKPKQVKFK